MISDKNPKAEGITWLSPQPLIKLRLQANQIPLDKSVIHAKQGGAYLSSFKGRGMEFDESRIYQPGDDIRNMDWRVTARTGIAHSKTFCEERERPVLLWLDLRPDMMFATRRKFKAVIACEIASLLAWSASNNNDRIGGLIFSTDEQVVIRPRRGKTAVLDFIARCTKHSAWSSSQEKPASNHLDNIAATKKISAVSRLQKITHPGSLIFMISDFHGLQENDFSHIANTAKNNDIIFIKISDPFEINLPAAGIYKLSDGDKTLQLQTTNKKTREKYHQRYQHREQQLKDFCRKHRIHLAHISTQDDVVETLKASLGIKGTRSASSHAAQFRSA